MQTIFAIDGSDFGAASQDVATLQNALVALGKGIGDTSLSKLTIDGLIGPKTTAAVNRAFTVHLGSGQAPASYRTGALSQSQVEAGANTLAAYIETELVRRGYSAPPVKIVTPTKKAATGTAARTSAVATVPTATYISTAAKPAVYLPPDASDAASSQGTQIVKWSAIGLGAVVVAGLAYYLIKKKARPALVMADFGENPRRLSNKDREAWINSDEGLYTWYQRASRRGGGMKKFIKDNKAEIDAAILSVLDRHAG
jgi:hypothetical protein